MWCGLLYSMSVRGLDEPEIFTLSETWWLLESPQAFHLLRPPLLWRTVLSCPCTLHLAHAVTT